VLILGNTIHYRWLFGILVGCDGISIFNRKPPGGVTLVEKKKRSFRKDFLHALLESAYFPADLPPIFTTKFFSGFCRDNFKIIENNESAFTAKSTQYATFNVPRPNSGRRKMAIVNPVAQLGLSLLITNKRNEIKRILEKSKISMYGLEERLDEGKAFAGLDFDLWHEKQYELSSKYPYGGLDRPLDQSAALSRSMFGIPISAPFWSTSLYPASETTWRMNEIESSFAWASSTPKIRKGFSLSRGQLTRQKYPRSSSYSGLLTRREEAATLSPSFSACASNSKMRFFNCPMCSVAAIDQAERRRRGGRRKSRRQ
jgi:hypothetical protein